MEQRLFDYLYGQILLSDLEMEGRGPELWWMLYGCTPLYEIGSLFHEIGPPPEQIEAWLAGQIILASDGEFESWVPIDRKRRSSSTMTAVAELEPDSGSFHYYRVLWPSALEAPTLDDDRYRGPKGDASYGVMQSQSGSNGWPVPLKEELPRVQGEVRASNRWLNHVVDVPPIGDRIDDEKLPGT